MTQVFTLRLHILSSYGLPLVTRLGTHAFFGFEWHTLDDIIKTPLFTWYSFHPVFLLTGMILFSILEDWCLVWDDPGDFAKTPHFLLFNCSGLMLVFYLGL